LSGPHADSLNWSGNKALHAKENERFPRNIREITIKVKKVYGKDAPSWQYKNTLSFLIIGSFW
jgi:hypothetical protein